MSVNMSMPVLVVDDYNTMIRIITSLLRQLGFSDVDGAGDAARALHLMRSRPYRRWPLGPGVHAAGSVQYCVPGIRDAMSTA